MKGGGKSEILYNRKSAMDYLIDNHSTLFHKVGMLRMVQRIRGSLNHFPMFTLFTIFIGLSIYVDFMKFYAIIFLY